MIISLLGLDHWKNILKKQCPARFFFSRLKEFKQILVLV
jgi:hypothetical protein